MPSFYSFDASAAEQLFRALGYRRARIEDVARVAGIDKGSVYLLFESQEALYLAVIDACMSRLLDEFDDVLHGAGSAPDRLQGVIHAAIEAFGRDELLRVSLMGSAQDRTEQPAFRRAAITQRVRVGALLEEGRRQGIAEGTIRASLDVQRTATVTFEMGWLVVRAELEGVLLTQRSMSLTAVRNRGLITHLNPDQAPPPSTYPSARPSPPARTDSSDHRSTNARLQLSIADTVSASQRDADFIWCRVDLFVFGASVRCRRPGSGRGGRRGSWRVLGGGRSWRWARRDTRRAQEC